METIPADLLDDGQLASLPDAKNIIYLVGNKFGTTGNESYTWAMNTYLPGKVAEKFRSLKDRRVLYRQRLSLRAGANGRGYGGDSSGTSWRIRAIVFRSRTHV